MKYEFPPLLLLPNETLNITAEVEGKQMDNLEKHLILFGLYYFVSQHSTKFSF